MTQPKKARLDDALIDLAAPALWPTALSKFHPDLASAPSPGSVAGNRIAARVGDIPLPLLLIRTALISLLLKAGSQTRALAPASPSPLPPQVLHSSSSLEAFIADGNRILRMRLPMHHDAQVEPGKEGVLIPSATQVQGGREEVAQCGALQPLHGCMGNGTGLTAAWAMGQASPLPTSLNRNVPGRVLGW